MRKQDTRFQRGVSGNKTAKWKPGQSGNPAGTSKRRMQFEEAFNDALLTEGGPRGSSQVALGSRARQGTLGHPGTVPAVCATDAIAAPVTRGTR